MEPTSPGTRGTDHSQPALLVSCDTHCGPRLREDLRAYCPAALLDEFDAFAAAWENDAGLAKLFGAARGGVVRYDPQVVRATTYRNVLTDGGWDMAARLRDMDADGIAAEVIYHGLNAGRMDPLPFSGDIIDGVDTGKDRRLAAVGRHIYNAWLADFVCESPERHVGLAQLPMWDVEAAVQELVWARAAGLRGVNFPRPRPSMPPYNDPYWEPFWVACSDLDMTLCTHGQGAQVHEYLALNGEGNAAILTLEMVGDGVRKSLHQMVFGQVFSRHPNLRLVFTEQPGTWWTSAMEAMDSVQAMLEIKQSASNLSATNGSDQAFYRDARVSGFKPSEIAARHLYVGGSFLAHFEAEDACRNGYHSQLMWGSDYPHVEGTWQYPRYDGEPAMTHLALRDAFAGLPPDAVKDIMGGNAIRAFGFDREKLSAVAARIGAPTLSELTRPLESIEDPSSTNRAAFGAFRQHSSFH